ncbi:MAG: flagellar filament capping protein FliD [Legionella sp.]|uniref:flagellar filament capping protein FliD n=1 Tax=Legionella sp. TaxID=459 RepID=UPI0028453048|nr:flagellar filament capping protein FliD [Legionella sp.]
MGLSSPGIGSGLDIKGMVDAMVKADIARVQARHDKKLTYTNAEISAIGQVKSILANLQSTLSNLSNISQINKMKSSISDPQYFDAVVTNQVQPGVYQVQVQSLAQSQSLSSAHFANSTTAVGEGTITINFGTYSSDLTTFTANSEVNPLTITIAPGSDSLAAVCDAINAADAGVNACIVQDSLGARLSLTSSETGENYAMQITSDIAALNYDPTTSNTSLTQNLAAQNSVVLINGMTINQSTNQLKDVLTGVTLNLKEVTTGSNISLTVTNNQEHLTACINDFIKKYNECITLLNNAVGYDAETKASGFFQGDAQIKALKQDMQQVISNFTGPSGNPFQSLTDIGITTKRGGILELDQDTFKTALSENFEAIGALFAKSITATDSNIQINSMDTKVAAGRYDVVLTDFVPGVSLAGRIGDLPGISTDGITLTGAGRFNSLSINVLAGGTGDRGQIIVNDGVAVLLDKILDGYVGDKGEFEERTDTLNKSVTQLSKDQKQIDEKSKMLEQKYLKRWNAVDLLISKLQDTSGMLSQVLANLPKLKVKD